MSEDWIIAIPVTVMLLFLIAIVLLPKPPFGDTIHITDSIKAYKNALGNQYFVK